MSSTAQLIFMVVDLEQGSPLDKCKGQSDRLKWVAQAKNTLQTKLH